MVILLVLFFLLVVWLLRNEAKARFLSLSVMKCAAAHFVTIELLEHQEAGFGPRSGPLYMDRGKAVGAEVLSTIVGFRIPAFEMRNPHRFRSGRRFDEEQVLLF